MSHLRTGRNTRIDAIPSKHSEIPIAVGAYLTDGERLFHVERYLYGRGGRLYELENCRTLELVAWPRAVIDALGMRIVWPTSR